MDVIVTLQDDLIRYKRYYSRYIKLGWKCVFYNIARSDRHKCHVCRVFIRTECNRYLVSGFDAVPDSALSASSVQPRNGYIHAVTSGRLTTKQKVMPAGVLSGAWVPAKSDVHQWTGVSFSCYTIESHKQIHIYM